jgi:hypothetical protein
MRWSEPGLSRLLQQSQTARAGSEDLFYRGSEMLVEVRCEGEGRVSPNTGDVDLAATADRHRKPVIQNENSSQRLRVRGRCYTRLQKSNAAWVLSAGDAWSVRASRHQHHGFEVVDVGRLRFAPQ